jgi:hypothetical protein
MSIEFIKKEGLGNTWAEYQTRFPSLPEFYFKTLQYPTSCSKAEELVRLIQLEMNSIDAQFIERRVELETVNTAQKDSVTAEHERWKLKALRAVRMKAAQIQILQAWIADNSKTYESRFTQLESELSALRKALLKLVSSVEISDSTYCEIIKLLA